MSDPTTLLLIDDHPLMRSGVKQLLALDPQLQVIAEAGNGPAGIELAKTLQPDMILLDLNMPGVNGLETLTLLRQSGGKSRIIVFSVSDSQEDVVEALRLGADGYLLKDMEPEILLQSLQQAAQGKMVLSEGLNALLAHNLREGNSQPDRELSQLTPRERDIFRLIAQGLPNKTIGRRLNISESTVKVHVKHLLKKMQLKSRVEAAIWAIQQGKV